MTKEGRGNKAVLWKLLQNEAVEKPGMPASAVSQYC